MSETLKIISMQDIAARKSTGRGSRIFQSAKSQSRRWQWRKNNFHSRNRAAIPKGILLPENTEIITPSNVIYQTAGDGLADTIKPRLLALDTDCFRVLVIDESGVVWIRSKNTHRTRQLRWGSAHHPTEHSRLFPTCRQCILRSLRIAALAYNKRKVL